MTIGELKKIIKGIPNDTIVFIGTSDDVVGGLNMDEACKYECGFFEVIDYLDPDDEQRMSGNKSGFVLMKHGTISHDEDGSITPRKLDLN